MTKTLSHFVFLSLKIDNPYYNKQQQQQEMMRQEQEQQLLFQKQQREEQFRMQQQQEEQLRIQQQQYMVRFKKYHIVECINTSRLEACFGYYRLLMKRKLYSTL